VIKGN
ncbi:hypothetical protein ECEC1856_5330, partial [Escherichia coli EC1856]